MLLPLQFANFFYTQDAMWDALFVSVTLDAIFILDFVFRAFVFAPHPTKKLDPYYVMMGRHFDPGRIPESMQFKARDLPTSTAEVRSRWVTMLELVAMIPLNALGLVPSLYSVFRMNVVFRLNKLLYPLLFMRAAKKTTNVLIHKCKAGFVEGRLLQLIVVCLLVLHWVSCVWLRQAEFEPDPAATQPVKTWLSEMSAKKQMISTWSEDPGYAYLLSLYFVTITMTTTGYGDITPVSSVEIVLTTGLIILGDAILAVMAGLLIEYITNINERSLEVAIKERSITHYLEHRIEVIEKRSAEIVEAQRQQKEREADEARVSVLDEGRVEDDPWRFAIDKSALEKQRLNFKRLKDRVKRYCVQIVFPRDVFLSET